MRYNRFSTAKNPRPASGLKLLSFVLGLVLVSPQVFGQLPRHSTSHSNGTHTSKQPLPRSVPPNALPAVVGSNSSRRELDRLERPSAVPAKPRSAGAPPKHISAKPTQHSAPIAFSGRKSGAPHSRTNTIPRPR